MSDSRKRRNQKKKQKQKQKKALAKPSPVTEVCATNSPGSISSSDNSGAEMPIESQLIDDTLVSPHQSPTLTGGSEKVEGPADVEIAEGVENTTQPTQVSPDNKVETIPAALHESDASEVDTGEVPLHKSEKVQGLQHKNKDQLVQEVLEVPAETPVIQKTAGRFSQLPEQELELVLKNAAKSRSEKEDSHTEAMDNTIDSKKLLQEDTCTSFDIQDRGSVRRHAYGSGNEGDNLTIEHSKESIPVSDALGDLRPSVESTMQPILSPITFTANNDDREYTTSSSPPKDVQETSSVEPSRNNDGQSLFLNTENSEKLTWGDDSTDPVAAEEKVSPLQSIAQPVSGNSDVLREENTFYPTDPANTLPWDEDELAPAIASDKLPWEEDTAKPVEPSGKMPWEEDTSELAKPNEKIPWEDGASQPAASGERIFGEDNTLELVAKNDKVLLRGGAAPPAVTDEKMSRKENNLMAVSTSERIIWGEGGPLPAVSDGKISWEENTPQPAIIPQPVSTTEKMPWEEDASQPGVTTEKMPWEEDASQPGVTTEKMPWEEDASQPGKTTETMPWEEHVYQPKAITQVVTWEEKNSQQLGSSDKLEQNEGGKLHDQSEAKVKKFSFLAADDELLNDDEDEAHYPLKRSPQQDRKTNQEGSLDGDDDDSFLDSDSDEFPVDTAQQVPGPSYIPPTTTAGVSSRSSLPSISVGTSLPVPNLGTYDQPFIQGSVSVGPSPSELPKSNFYAPVLPVQPPNPLAPVNHASFSAINSSTILHTSGRMPHPEEESRKQLEKEKKKSDAYDFPLDLFKNKQILPAKPVAAKVNVPIGVIAANQGPQIAGMSSPAYGERSMSQSIPAPIPMKNPYQPSVYSEKGSASVTSDGVARERFSAQPKPYSLPGINAQPPVADRIIPAGTVMPSNPLAKSVTAQTGGIYGAAYAPPPVPLQKQHVPPSLNLASQNDRNNSVYGVPQRTRAISNASGSSSGSYAVPSIQNVPGMDPKYGTHIPPKPVTIQTSGLPITSTNGNSPSTQRRTHARSNSSVYAPSQAPHASKYMPTVHPQFQKPSISSELPSKHLKPVINPLPRTSLPTAQVGSQSHIADPSANNYDYSFRQFPIFHWGNSGKVVYALPPGINSGNFMVHSRASISHITICPPDTILKPTVVLKEFPGPLIKGKTKTRDIEKWFDTSIKYFTEYEPTKSLILWSLLKQKLVAPVSIKAMSKLFWNAEGTLPYMSKASGTLKLTSMPPSRLDRNEQLQILSYLQNGAHDSALELALSHKDYAMALVLASLVGKEKWSEVVDIYLNNEFQCVPGDAHSVNLLALIFQVFVGNAKRLIEEFNTSPSKRAWVLSYWNIIIATVLNNVSEASDPHRMPPVVIEFIVGFGVFLIKNGSLEAGITCLVLADVPLSNKELLPNTGVVFESFGSMNSLDSMMLSEVYEFTFASKENFTYFSSLLFSKVAHAAVLLDYNIHAPVAKYVDLVTSALRTVPKNSPLYVALTSRLELIDIQLSGVATGWLGKPKLSSVWGQLDKSFNKFIGGDDDDYSKPPEKTVFDSFTPNASRNASMVDLNHGFTPLRPPVAPTSLTHSHSDVPLSKTNYQPHGFADNSSSNMHPLSYTPNKDHVKKALNPHSSSPQVSQKQNYVPRNSACFLSPKVPDDSHSHSLAQLAQSNNVSPSFTPKHHGIPEAVTPPPIFSAPPRKTKSRYAASNGSTASLNKVTGEDEDQNANYGLQDTNDVKTASLEHLDPLVARIGQDGVTDLNKGRRKSTVSSASHSSHAAQLKSSKSEILLPPKKSSVSSHNMRKPIKNYSPSLEDVSIMPAIQVEPISIHPDTASLNKIEMPAYEPYRKPYDNFTLDGLDKEGTKHHISSGSSISEEEGKLEVGYDDTYKEKSHSSLLDGNSNSKTADTLIKTVYEEANGSIDTVNDYAEVVDKLQHTHAGVAQAEEYKQPKGCSKDSDSHIGKDFTSSPEKVQTSLKPAHVTTPNPYAFISSSAKKMSSNPYTPRSVILEDTEMEDSAGSPLESPNKGFYRPLEKGKGVCEPDQNSVSASGNLAHPIPRSSRFEPIKEVAQSEEDSFRSDKVPVIRAASNPNFTPYTPKASEQYYDDVVEDESDEEEGEENKDASKEVKTKNSTAQPSANASPASAVSRSNSVSSVDVPQMNRNTEKSHTGSGWFGWLKKDPKEKKPIKAKLGNKNNFYYDEKLKRWVNKDANEEEKMKVATPPPPPPVVKRKINNTPEIKPRSGSVVGGPAVRTQGAIAPINPLTGESITQSSNSPSPSPIAPFVKPRIDSNISLAGKTANGLDDLISLTSGQANGVTRRKKKPGRGYVNVMNNM